MKRGEKWWMAFAVLTIGGISAFSILYGISTQRRNAALAKISVPENVDRFRNFQAAQQQYETAREAAPARDMAVVRMQDRIDAFEALFNVAESTYTAAEWNELMLYWDEGAARWPDWPDDIKEKLLRLVASIQPLIAQIRIEAAQGGPIYALDFSKGYTMELPHLSKLRHLGRLLIMDTLAASASDDPARVVDDIIAVTQLCNAIGEEPVYLSQLVRIAVSDMACHTIGIIAPTTSLPPQQFDRLMQRLAEQTHRDYLARGFAGEALAGETAFERPETLLGSHYDSDRGRRMEYALLNVYTSAAMRPLSNFDESTLLETVARLQSLAALPYYEAREEILQLEQEVEHISRLRLLSHNILPALTRGFEAQARHEATIDLARIGLASEQYRAQSGEYPQSLTELLPYFPSGVPVDTYTGDPFIYRTGADSIVLYSVGANLRDDNGRHGYTTGDIVWRGVSEER